MTEPAAVITLRRPKELNAWTGRMGAQAKHALARAPQTRPTKAVRARWVR